ncbi:MAG: DUF5688 family protein [Lachnospiraceae bacterium]
MTFKSFRECILETFKETYEGKVEITMKEVQKLNGVKRYGIMFQDENKEISPTIYLENYYDRYCNEQNIDQIIVEILEVYKKEKDLFHFSIKDFQDFEKVQEQLFVKLIHIEKNKELLEDTPYISFLEYAVVAYYKLRQEDIERGSILIKKEHCKLWGCSEQEMLYIARENAIQKNSITLDGMRSLMVGFLGEEQLLEEQEEMMYVLSNDARYFGASVLCYPDTIRTIVECLKEDFYVLPSSVHELILVPLSKAPTVQELLTMVQEVNDTQVELEEILSYSILYYSIEKEEFAIVKGEKKLDI